MTATDYNQDIGPGLSKGVTQTQIDHAHNEAVAQKQINEAWAAGAFVAVILVAIVAAHTVAQHRRKLAKAADTALISGLATGVRAARAARSKGDTLVGRVLAKADEKTPSPE